MKSIDVVIVSDAKNHFLQKLTEAAIETSVTNEKNVLVNVIVVEKQDAVYQGCKTVKQTGEFCYNRFLSEGAKLGSGEYICFANNDLIFGDNWASEIISNMEKENVRSASPYCHLSNIKNKSGYNQKTGNHFGHEVRKEFAGFCFVWKRELFEEIGLDERLAFWASDDATAEVLKMNNEKHILCTSSFVAHLSYGSNTLNILQSPERSAFMHDQVKKFNRLYSKNLYGIGIDKWTGRDITAIIPIFGDIVKWEEKYKRAERSIHAQTVRPKYSLISLGDNLKNSRNIPALNAKTEWILFVDADDELDEHYIEEMLKIEDADIIVPAAHRYFKDGTVDDSNRWYEPIDLLTGNYIVIGALIRTELFKKLGGFKDLKSLEDWEFFIRAEEAGAKFKQCRKAIYKIHVSENSRNADQSLMPEIIYEAKKRRGLL